MPNRRYALWAEGVGKSFGKTVALKAASLWAEAGKVTTLMGRNGSGKTTLMKGHDARVLLEISDVIIWSVAGTTHHLGATADALAHRQFRREYLGPAWSE